VAHDEAIGAQAAERYVAGELTPPERSAFEEHFFDCPECADKVRGELVFAANARVLLCYAATAAPKPVWWEVCAEWFRPRRALAYSLAGNAVLALGFGFFILAGPRAAIGPRLLPAYLAPGPARGTGDMPVHQIPSGAPAFLAQIRMPGPRVSFYFYEILDVGGKRESVGAVSPPGGQDNALYLEVPVAGLAGGVHTLEVRGKPGNIIISRSKFQTSR
jgi:hypothetical protein